MNCSTDFYLSQAAGYAIDAVCLSRITAKVISQFHLNLMIWLDLPSERID